MCGGGSNGVKALVLGCGSIGIRHVQHLRMLGVESIEVADPNRSAREAVKQKFGIVAEEQPEAALSRRPDIVLVCTPAATHLPLVIGALEVGAHVFVEKPLSVNLEGVDALLQKVQSDGRIVQVGYQLRYHPAMVEAKRILDSGRLGKILTAHAEFGLFLERWWPGRDYRKSYMASDDLGGGLLLDVSHEIDLMVWFLGPVKEVTAYGEKLSHLQIPGFDALKAIMRMVDGTLLSLSMDCLQPTYTRSFSLVGEGTALRWDCPEGRADRSLGRLQLFDRDHEIFQTIPLEGNPEDSYLEELKAFLSAVENGQTPLVGVAQGIEVLRVVEGIQAAIRSRSSVAVSSGAAP